MNSSTLPSLERLKHLNSPFPNREADKQIIFGLQRSKCKTCVIKASKIAKFCGSDSEPIEKFFKNTNRFLEILAKVQLISDTGLIALAASLKQATDVLESLRFIGALKIFLVPQNNRYFLLDPTVSFQKKSSRALLLGHTGCKTLRALNKWKLIDLGSIAKYKIGSHLTCFHLLTDGLMIASSFFSLWESSFRFRTNYTSLRECDRKITKWEKQWLSLGSVLSGDQEEAKKLQALCEAKIKEISQQIELKRQVLLHPTYANDPGKIQEIKVLEKRLTKNEYRLQKLNSGDYIALVGELSKKDVLTKVESERYKRKSIKEFTQDVVKVASAASKIFVIALAILFTTLNITSTIPLVVLLACGIIADSIGLTKIYMERGPRVLSSK